MMNILSSDRTGKYLALITILYFFVFQPLRGQDSTTVVPANLRVVNSDTAKVIICYFSPQAYGQESFVGYTAGHEIIDSYGTDFMGADSIVVPVTLQKGNPKYFDRNFKEFPMNIFAFALRKDWE